MTKNHPHTTSFRKHRRTTSRLLLQIVITLFSFIIPTNTQAEDGHRLWLRMTPNKTQADVRIAPNTKQTPTTNIAINELTTYYKGNEQIRLEIDTNAPKRDGYRITTKNNKITINSSTDKGLLYGTYALLRQGKATTIESIPAYDLRILNHWDNIDGTVERGYAGKSIWNWQELPTTISPRYKEYARANASIGINGTVLNNVNASPQILSTDMLIKIATIADILRPYGIQTFLSVNFASPIILGGLDTADPFSQEVRQWWQNKTNEIYRLIPDFGGFLVKANSEGQPGPQDYGRTHADGANMLADILKQHNGIVMWRAFVYSATGNDRACLAYREFMPLDGTFRDNVIIQIKNGPIDFQPREPFSPLFGSMQHTQIMPELQITQEYLGQSIHTVFLPPLWKECLDAQTYAHQNATVAKQTQKHHTENSITAIAGVSNIGNDTNWTGSHMAQANWYAFGRLAWDTDLTAAEIADEFLTQTFTDEKKFIEKTQSIMLASWETAINYMMPLGLHHIFAFGHHYGPEPWCNVNGRPDWLPKYYHKADSVGIGFDRTTKGSGFTKQYNEPLTSQYDNIDTCPEQMLLWFHHTPWKHIMHNGQTLWDNLCHAYNNGARQAQNFYQTWSTLEGYIDNERYQDILQRFNRQALDAQWWRDACISYFQTFSKMPIPTDCDKPRLTLHQCMEFNLPIDNYTAAPINLLP